MVWISLNAAKRLLNIGDDSVEEFLRTTELAVHREPSGTVLIQVPNAVELLLKEQQRLLMLASSVTQELYETASHYLSEQFSRGKYASWGDPALVPPGPLRVIQGQSESQVSHSEPSEPDHDQVIRLIEGTLGWQDSNIHIMSGTIRTLETMFGIWRGIYELTRRVKDLVRSNAASSNTAVSDGPELGPYGEMITRLVADGESLNKRLEDFRRTLPGPPIIIW